MKFELWARPGLFSFNFKKHQTTSKQHPNKAYKYIDSRGGGGDDDIKTALFRIQFSIDLTGQNEVLYSQNESF